MSAESMKPGELSPLKRALVALDEMQERLEASTRETREPIAVIGMGCRLPGGAHEPETFWRLLADGVDAVTEVPAGRWDLDAFYDPDPDAPGKTYTKWGGFLQAPIDEFDAHAFGIAPREATEMDPQQRLLLEVSSEALERAGQAPDRLQGSRTGVFVGICSNDYARINGFADDPGRVNAYSASGVAHSVAAGRISYVLGLQGPSVAVDTACSSSLVALHLACQSLRLRESRMALAAGVHVMLSPSNTIVFCKSKMMSPEGRCKTFGDSADGFVLGEGCGVLVLKRLSDAQADGDPILALIRGSAINQDGASSGLTVPNGPSQEAVIAEALSRAGLSPADVDYVEAHGTGTSLGDPIEVSALGNAFGAGRPTDRPLIIGSAKSNLGHLEAAAGITGTIKLILSLQHERIPPHLHASPPSRHIAWEELPVRVAGEGRPWARGERPRIGGVSSFGFSGTNAHVLIEEAPAAPARAPLARERLVHLVTLSGRSEDMVRETAARYAAHLRARPETRIADFAFSANTGRPHRTHRAALLTRETADLLPRLHALAAGESPLESFAGVLQGADRPRPVFLFSGQGAQYSGMGRGLYESQPTFRTAIDRCAATLGASLDRSLTDLLFEPASAAALDETGYTQPALFALEYALATLWRSWGIEPLAVLGHSVGEYAAACVAGVFEVEDGLRLIAARGRLMQALPRGGTMAALLGPEEQVAEALRPFRDRVAIAAVNGPANTVIAGEATAVDAIRAALNSTGVGSKPLAVSHAFHSPLMEPMIEDFARAAAEIRYAAPRIPLVSNLTGERLKVGEVPDAAYWVRHVRETVRFGASVVDLARRGASTYLEIGPGSTLAGMGGQCVSDPGALWVTSLRKGKDDTTQVLSALAALYARGALVDWKAFDRDYARRTVVLPTSPFQRTRYWVDKKAMHPAAGRPESPATLLGRRLSSPVLADTVFETTMSATQPDFVQDHVVLEAVVFPGTGHLALARAAGALALSAPCVELTGVAIQEALVFSADAERTVQVVVSPEEQGRASFRIFSRGALGEEWRLHASGEVMRSKDPSLAAPPDADLAAARARCTEEVEAGSFYDAIGRRGLSLGPRFRGVARIFKSQGEAVGLVEAPPDLGPSEDADSWHPALLDACVQVLSAAFPGPEDVVYMPVGIDAVSLAAPGAGALWSHVRVREGAAETVRADVTVTNAVGQVVARLEGMAFRKADADRLRSASASPDDPAQWLYRVDWRPRDRQSTPPPAAASWPEPASLASSVAPRYDALAQTHGFAALEGLLPRIDQSVAAFIAEALAGLGWDGSPGRASTVDELADALGVPAGHRRRVLGRLLEILTEQGHARRTGSRFEAVSRPAGDARAQVAALAAAHPAFAAELGFLERCGPHLGPVLRGEVDPLTLLFPEGSTRSAESLYLDSPAARTFKAVVGEVVEGAIAALPPEARVRVLEIGGGTGGTTSGVLPALPRGRTDYLFTDVSPLFVKRALDRFASYGSVRGQALDIEKDPTGQGLAGESFDIVVAANVLHATTDLRTTFRHVFERLAPGGLLILVEVTRPQGWIDLTFGLTEGWWKFTDEDVRPDYPLLSPERWSRFLASAGFTGAALVPGSPMGAADPLQTVVVARRPLAPSRHDCVIVADRGGVGDALAAQMRARGGRAVIVPPTASSDELRLGLTGADAPSSVVYLRGLDAHGADSSASELQGEQSESLGGALQVVQALGAARFALAPRLFLVSRGAQAVGASGATLSPSPATLWGLGKVIALEHPELRCTRVDLDAESVPETAAVLVDEVLKADVEDQVAVREGQRHVARLVRHVLPRAGAIEPARRLKLARPGVLDALELEPFPRRVPGPGEVEIQVRAAGLNFRDVLNALAMRADDDPLGGECAGTVVAVGAGVQEPVKGDEVLGVALGCFASYVTTDTALLVKKPARLSFEEAATLPLVFMTAAHALLEKAQLKRGDRVLVHAAAGGVGMAAVQLVREAGGLVFATAGSDEKRGFLRSLGVEHVMDSRSLAFADEIKALTGGRGVDVVLNSLAGEFIPKSLASLTLGGRFLEIGKSEIWEPARMAAERPDVAYHVIDLSVALKRDPRSLRPLLVGLVDRIEAGALQPLPIRRFALADAPRAFRFMAQARHIGKVVLVPAVASSAATRLRGEGAYLITGGMRGLGLRVARWMVDRGARHLVLMGRQEPSAEARAEITDMELAGARIEVVRGDVSLPADVARAVSAAGPALCGVVHSAGLLDDGVLLQQDSGRFRHVLDPKVQGGWNLHQATRRHPLDFFVLFSSVSSLLGSAGQGNHAAANAFLDALAHLRQRQGRPGLSINWGAWSQIGAAADRNLEGQLAARGIGTFTPDQGLEVLETLMARLDPQVGVIPVDWARFLAASRAASLPFYEEVERQERRTVTPTAAGPRTAGDLRRRVEEAPPNQRRKVILAYVKDRAVKVLGLDPGQPMDHRQPLNQMGLDSLMAVELKTLLGAGLGLAKSLPATLVFDHPSVNDLTDFLAREVFAIDERTTPAPPVEVQATPHALDRIEQLSDEEVERLLERGSPRSKP
jgi:acyl transferase domain-containing protein